MPQLQTTTNFPHLTSPLQVGTTTLRNRLVMGSMHSGLEDRTKDIPKLAAYLGRRAAGGTGLIVTGGYAPNVEGWLLPAGSLMASRRMADNHRQVTDAIHEHQSHVVLQILHAGRYSYSPFARSADTTKSPISPFKAHRMTGWDVERTIRAYVRAAKLAQRAGYDGIEIMGSEGYLINQFLAARTNHRTDEWGGSPTARMRFPINIVRRIREAVGPDFLLQYRISLLDLVEDGQTWEETADLARGLEEAGVDIFNTGIGWHEARVPTIVTSVPRAAFADLTGRLKQTVSAPVVASNRINRPEVAEQILAEGQADLISMARPLLADPDFLNKAASGRQNLINTCIACNQACLDHTFAGKRSTCMVNPLACYETELLPTPTRRAQRVAVIGGGMAGLAYAAAAAERGHRPELFEASDRVGGQFNLAAAIPGKEDYAETIRYFTNRLRELEVPVHLNTWVSVDEMRRKYDHVVVATGVTPRVPRIEGIDHPSVIPYDELLSGAREAGRRVAVIGAGGIGVDVCEFLTRKPNQTVAAWKQAWGVGDPARYRAGLVTAGAGAGTGTGTASAATATATTAIAEHDEFHIDREVHLLQRKTSRIGKHLGKTTGWVHRAELKKAGVHQYTGVTYERIDDAGLHITIDGKPQVIEVDNVIICTGQESNLDSLSAEQLQSRTQFRDEQERAAQEAAQRGWRKLPGAAQVQRFGEIIGLDGHSAASSSPDANSSSPTATNSGIAGVTIVGGADVAAELDAKRAIRQATEEALRL